LVTLGELRMTKYKVTFVSYGHAYVEADNEEKAIELAYLQSNWDQFDIPKHTAIEKELENA